MSLRSSLVWTALGKLESFSLLIVAAEGVQNASVHSAAVQQVELGIAADVAHEPQHQRGMKMATVTQNRETASLIGSDKV